MQQDTLFLSSPPYTRNKHNSRSLRKNFGQKCQYLARFPYIGKSYDYLRPNLRGLLVMGYVVFYQVSDDSIKIVRVLVAIGI
ncbi:type II toxin-antitoxin system RelE/ParE family toxin [Picosynechococcus sp. PCC 11901]|uniref:type II toxin-antitoxin system RelE/ParE family toxin n=1 Tax=Picosynechococcus sp. PCC 11901 TaxID=2579791 RepID=UPI002101F026|nr:type II toxin-antitoxin system RelE/ParE family toxin [Picosynechococcus sp. PCC 11901]